MNVTCTGCPAKYAVPDEKVRGKKVRITCKHCGTNIIVDGTATAADDATLLQRAPASPAAEASYLVGFPDDSQRPHTIAEIVFMYQVAKIDDEALVWKDGMSDWLSPFDVPEIAAAMHARGVARRAAQAAAAPAPAKKPSEPKLAAVPAAVASEPDAVTAKPAAARRPEQRAPAVDLFGAVAHAGSEADASLDFGLPQDDFHKLTGARNESSVLFSLDALTKPDAKAAGKQKARDKREEEKQASAELFGDSAPDSLMNLGGGGFQALAAPDFTKPVTAAPEPLPVSAGADEFGRPAKRSSAGIWVAALLGAAVAAGAVFFVMQKKMSGEEAAMQAASAAASQATASPEPSASVAPTASVAAEATASAAETSQSASPAESAAQAITAQGSKPGTPVTPSTAVAVAVAAPAGNRATEKPVANKTADTAAAAPTTAATASPTPAADGVGFDRSAAVSALGAAAANAASCKTADGPTGAGKVSVTFAPSGRATMTNVGGVFAGTEVGGCVARLFRAAKVPAFSGDPVTVSKGFSIE